ncbi:hypothetical protein DAEQUDRAFT_729508 [Daedalea quercina L-15889]|uniref:Stealth protein CR3 conserved region 3 domain-containing protein n=1 Tax=Daedalea quercina L-15889 TaxID=1314783 RepID=A0A165NKX9_9APHY|nr:hypothetical protein DAEQUDRAFT_729508 [Daedalea quercina L-15889]
MAKYVPAYFLRRRFVLATAFAASLLFLFLYLRHVFHDLDDELGLTASLESTSYIPFQVPPLPLPPPPPRTALRPVRDLRASCLDAHFSLGELCLGDRVDPLDVVWTWVNGSDFLLAQAKELAQSQYANDDPYRPVKSASQARLYRDHDELRYSIRSVVDNFKSPKSRFRLLTTDFSVPDAYANSINLTTPELWRLGQLPQWLDCDRRVGHGLWRDGKSELVVTHHGQFFRPYNGTVFNSLAIESQLGHVPDMSNYFIYMNDDLFMLNPVTPATFYTSAYGIVLHLQPDLVVKPDRPNTKVMGEWRSLGESNWLLSNRFGARARPYVAHEAKAAGLHLLHELSAVWPGAFAASALHRFRETAGGHGDVNTMFLSAHFVVERAREALLWAWVVGTLGGRADEWGPGEAQRAWRALGGAFAENLAVVDDMLVTSGWRDTLEQTRVAETLLAHGYDADSHLTSYVFSSLDGYPYLNLGSAGRPGFPSLAPDTAETALPRCRLSYAQCFTVDGTVGDGSKASEVFKQLAFRDPRCGDCVISALVKASGRLGLSAFLPPAERVVQTTPPPLDSDADADVPHLPLVDDWQKGDFSLAAVMAHSRETNVRRWTLQLLHRYRYILGSTPMMFERVVSGPQAAATVARIDKAREAALLCVNDDVSRPGQDADVSRVLAKWFDRRWGRAPAWER